MLGVNWQVLGELKDGPGEVSKGQGIPELEHFSMDGR